MPQKIRHYANDAVTIPRPGEFTNAAAEPGQRTGRWFPQATDAQSFTMIADRLYLVPIVLHRRRIIQKIGAVVPILGAAGSLLRYGIYADSDGTPVTRILDAGTVPADVSVHTRRTITLTGVVLDEGMYWLGVVSQGGPATQPSLRAVKEGNPLCGIFGTDNFQCSGYYMAAAVPGALPATLATNVVDSVITPVAAIQLL
jgi:hypothetical protein